MHIVDSSIRKVVKVLLFYFQIKVLTLNLKFKKLEKSLASLLLTLSKF